MQTINHNGREEWDVHLVDTGLAALTGGHLKRLESLIGKGTFMMTYGDGVCDVDIDKLLKFHRTQKGLVTLTAVRPAARFGVLAFEGNQIRHFKEKSTLHEGWINGGSFIIEPAAFSYTQEDVMWEHSPVECLAEEGQLYAYQHNGFWQCMDTLRELKYLDPLWESGNAPWKPW